MKHFSNIIQHCLFSIVFNSGCKAKADIVIALESSTRISSKGFENMKGFLERLVEDFIIGPDDVRFSAVTFNNDSTLQFNFNDHLTPRDLARAIIDIPYVKGGSNMASALKLIRTTFSSGGRQGAKQVAFIITNGPFDSPVETAQELLKVKDAGVQLISLGIGGKLDMDEQSATSTDPKKDMFVIKRYAQLKDLFEPLANRACAVSGGEIVRSDTGCAPKER